jgi:NAD(P)-dependent dehydrogenase (short-subunit alcohol dehydrogenase family)
MPRAMVTGPTSGIGGGFARELARQGHDLLLVSRNAERLERLARDLTDEFGVTCDIVRADLTDRADIDRVCEIAAEQPVDVLVNNAGFGVKGGFTETAEVDRRAADARRPGHRRHADSRTRLSPGWWTAVGATSSPSAVLRAGSPAAPTRQPRRG